MPVLQVPTGEVGGPGRFPNILNQEEQKEDMEEKKEDDEDE